MTKKKNDLDGKTWLKYSISIWSDIKKNLEEVSLKHPAIFPIALAERLISIYSYERDTVFDPFAGTGSTLIASKNLKRKSIGIELSSKYIKLYNNRTLSLFKVLENPEYEPIIYEDDANNLNNLVNENNIQLTVTSPPYWNILQQKRTADNKEIRKYSNALKDLGNIESYTDFIKSLKKIFKKVFIVTKKGGFCCIILMDLRKKNKFYPFHIDTIKFMEEIGFELDDIIIWDRKQEYNNLRPLGFPYVFRINKIHEYILIFKKQL